ncbi:MAG TPA: hypothetical protein DDZ88_17910 [Verrucomicrobiales bacterium]|nr:hypothetical protein [Verrucomicrobiales bacterium]
MYAFLFGRTLCSHTKQWEVQIRTQFFEEPAFFGFIVACLKASAVKETLMNDAPQSTGTPGGRVEQEVTLGCIHR